MCYFLLYRKYLDLIICLLGLLLLFYEGKQGGWKKCKKCLTLQGNYGVLQLSVNVILTNIRRWKLYMQRRNLMCIGEKPIFLNPFFVLEVGGRWPLLIQYISAAYIKYLTCAMLTAISMLQTCLKEIYAKVYMKFSEGLNTWWNHHYQDLQQLNLPKSSFSEEPTLLFFDSFCQS